MIICYTVPDIWCVTEVIIFHFGPFFALFYPPYSSKIQNSKKNENNTWKYHHFTQVYQIMIICYTVPEIWCIIDVIIFHFGYFLPFTPLTAQKVKIKKKMKKTPGDIIILHICTKNYNQMIYGT